MNEYFQKAKEIVTTALGQLLLVLSGLLAFALSQVNEKVDEVQAGLTGQAESVIERIEGQD